jgi:hypothetical protein
MQAAKAAWLMELSGVNLPVEANDDGVVAPNLDAVRLSLANTERDRENAARKAMLIADAMRTIDPLRPVLQQSLDLQLHDETKVGPVTIDTDKRAFGNKDLSKVADTRDVNQKTAVTNRSNRGADTETVLKDAQDALEIVVQLRRTLEAETTSARVLSPVNGGPADIVDGPPVPLFSRDEIIDGLIDPLIRSGVLPDGFVNDPYSRNAQMIVATNKLYTDETAKQKKDNSFGLAALGQTGVVLAANMAETMLAAVGQNSANIDTIINGATALASTMISAGDKLDDVVRGQATPQDVTSLFTSSLPSILKSFISGTTGDSTLAGEVSVDAQLVGAVVNVVASANFNPKALQTAVGNLIGSIMQEAASQIVANIGKSGGSTDLTSVGILAGVANDAGIVQVTKSLIAGDLRGAESGIVKISSNFAESLATQVIGTRSDGASSTALSAEDTYRKAAVADATGDIDAMNKQAAEQAKAVAAAKKAIEELKGRALDAEIDELLAARERDKKEFDNLLLGLGKESQLEHRIDDMTAKLLRDRAIFDLLVTIGIGGLEIASQFCGPVAMGTETVKGVANMIRAYENMKNLVALMEERSSARAVRSRYGSSLDNLIGNQEFELLKNSMAAAANGVRLVAAIAATAEPRAAPVLPAASALQAAVTLTFQAYKMNELRKAWNATRKALADPTNRRLAHQARKMDPLLAKCSLAYGAIEERDPIAVGIAKKCGLSDESLRNETADVAKVKRYLDAKFPQDSGGVKTEGVREDWATKLPDPELTKIGVMAVYDAIAAQFTSSKAAPAGNLLGLLAMLERELALDMGRIDDAIADTSPAAAVQRMEALRNKLAALERRGTILVKIANAINADAANLSSATGDRQVGVSLREYATEADKLGKTVAAEVLIVRGKIAAAPAVGV